MMQKFPKFPGIPLDSSQPFDMGLAHARRFQLFRAPYKRHIWVGGVPDNEFDWNDPQNWLNHQPPGWKSIVFIHPDFVHDDCFPQLDAKVKDIAQLVIFEGATLKILPEAELTVDGLMQESYGIINHGFLYNFGEINILNTRMGCIHNFGTLMNEGSIAVDLPYEEALQLKEGGSFYNSGEIINLAMF